MLSYKHSEKYLAQKLHNTVLQQYTDQTGFRFIFNQILDELFSYSILPENPYPFILKKLEIGGILI